jgi:dethiobiotin synthetase
MARRTSARIVFVTGTDTGVGKTVFTALLLAHLRSSGVNALALKPFCSGGRQDAKILHALQDGELTLEEVNPFYFSAPVAPLVAARAQRRRIAIAQVLNHIRGIAERCDWLLVEGAGGLLAPLGEPGRRPGPVGSYNARDLIRQLACAPVVVSRNQLGTINHTLLCLEGMGKRSRERTQVVFMQPAVKDPSGGSNAKLLSELLGGTPLTELPWLGRCSARASWIRAGASGNRVALARVVKHAQLR